MTSRYTGMDDESYFGDLFQDTFSTPQVKAEPLLEDEFAFDFSIFDTQFSQIEDLKPEPVDESLATTNCLLDKTGFNDRPVLSITPPRLRPQNYLIDDTDISSTAPMVDNPSASPYSSTYEEVPPSPISSSCFDLEFADLEFADPIAEGIADLKEEKRFHLEAERLRRKEKNTKLQDHNYLKSILNSVIENNSEFYIPSSSPMYTNLHQVNLSERPLFRELFADEILDLLNKNLPVSKSSKMTPRSARQHKAKINKDPMNNLKLSKTFEDVLEDAIHDQLPDCSNLDSKAVDMIVQNTRTFTEKLFNQIYRQCHKEKHLCDMLDDCKELNRSKLLRVIKKSRIVNTALLQDITEDITLLGSRHSKYYDGIGAAYCLLQDHGFDVNQKVYKYGRLMRHSTSAANHNTSAANHPNQNISYSDR